MATPGLHSSEQSENMIRRRFSASDFLFSRTAQSGERERQLDASLGTEVAQYLIDSGLFLVAQVQAVRRALEIREREGADAARPDDPSERRHDAQDEAGACHHCAMWIAYTREHLVGACALSCGRPRSLGVDEH